MPHTFTHGYALLIGVDENHVSGYALPDVAKDIQAVAKVLVHPRRCAYPKDNVKTLTGQEATRQGILDGLEWLQERIQADSSDNTTAIVYYTGHGWRNAAAGSSEFYLIPYDIREGKIKSRALRATDLAEAVSELEPRRLLVVLDCCHAGGMSVKGLPLPAGYVEAAIAPSLLMEGEKVSVGSAKGAKGLETLALGTGRAVLSSSTGEQSSYMRRDGKMSIFTYHLIEAFTGHAQPQEGATEVLVSDVMGHVWRRVPQSAKADWGRKQEPDYQVSGNFPIALLLGGKGLSKGQPAPDPLELSAGARDEDRDEQHVQIAVGSYIAQASGGSTATVSVNQPKEPNSENDGLVPLRLDAAVPDHVRLNRSFDLAVAVRQPSSPVLAEDDLTHVRSGGVQVSWPKAEPYIRLRMQVGAPECEIYGEDSHSFRLYPGQDSPIFYFHLTPKELGEIGIIVRVYQEDDWLGSARVRTFAHKQVVGSVQINITSHKIGGEMIKILFLAANPTDSTRLRLDEESRAIDQALRQSEFRDRFDIKQHWAVRVSDVQELLLRHQPSIVHFSGHGVKSSEIILENTAGNSHPVSVRALSTLFSVLKDNIRCVVLNACYSEQQARAIAEHIDCVVGMSKAIGDPAAISFSTAFYQALGYGRDVQTAFDLGCIQVDMENLDEQDTPKLLAVKSEPEKVVFVHTDVQPCQNVSQSDTPEADQDISAVSEVPPTAVVLQLKTLADHIDHDLELLKEYETTMQFEDDPRRRVKYQREIEALRKSIAAYLHDYFQLRSASEGRLPPAFQDTDAGLFDLAATFMNP